MLLRIRRKKASLERSFEDFFLSEFCNAGNQPDLTLSVYEVDPGQVVQAAAEHAAGLGLDYKGLDHFDLSQVNAPVVATPGDGPFSFTRDVHREIRFPDEESLRGFAKALYEGLTTGAIAAVRTEKSELRSHERSRLADGDAEWSSVRKG